MEDWLGNMTFPIGKSEQTTCKSLILSAFAFLKFIEMLYELEFHLKMFGQCYHAPLITLYYTTFYVFVIICTAVILLNQKFLKSSKFYFLCEVQSLIGTFLKRAWILVSALKSFEQWRALAKFSLFPNSTSETITM